MEAVKAGADGYVTKPVDPDELVPEIRNNLR
jgi:two-component system chemotaxis response regulator CheY